MNFVKKICAWVGSYLISRSLRGTGRTAPESDFSTIAMGAAAILLALLAIFITVYYQLVRSEIESCEASSGAWDKQSKTCLIAKQP